MKIDKNDGWIEWGGGECPVGRELPVDIKFRDGDREEGGHQAGAYRWNHKGVCADIIAYRPHRDINSRANDDRLEQDLNECIGQEVDMPEWSGDGVPHVGTECEIYNRSEWFAVKIKFIGDKWIVAEPLEGRNEECFENQFHGEDCYKPHAFRPLRTEAEKWREKLAASLHIAAGASPIELNGIGPLYFELADAIISGSVFGTTFKADK